MKTKKVNKKANLFAWINPELKVRSISKYGDGGKGVFAIKNIRKNEVLAVFGGYIMKAIDVQNSPFYNDDYSLQISEDFLIGQLGDENICDADFFNHSCDPNAGFRGQIFLVAMKSIKKEEEVTFDYAMVLQKMKGVEPYEMECLCGSRKCRNIVTENDWKIENLQRKYDGYFQFFIQEKINKIKNKK